MSIAAIIAEYNPFYSGHQYQIRELRKRLGEDTQILALMSGDFVQRGEPAIMDKYLRTELALRAGVSAVAQLPVWMSTASAADFAEGAVRILNALGCIDYICFGCENDDLELLRETARIFAEEPGGYREILRENLSRGKSFPAAREDAYLRYLQQKGAGFYQEERDWDFLKLPNNILAISYLVALYKTKSRIRPLAIKRQGNYHAEGSNQILQGPADPAFPGASAVRKELCSMFLEEKGKLAQMPEVLLTSPEALHLLEKGYGRRYPVRADDLFVPLKTSLSIFEEDLAQFADVSEEMAARLQKGWFAQSSYEELVDYLHTANYTRSRVCRDLLHILLGLRQADVSLMKERGWAYYLRILGFRREEEQLIRTLSAASKIPVLMHAKLTREEENRFAGPGLISCRYDIKAADCYEQILQAALKPGRKPVREYSKGIIKV